MAKVTASDSDRAPTIRTSVRPAMPRVRATFGSARTPPPLLATDLRVEDDRAHVRGAETREDARLGCVLRKGQHPMAGSAKHDEGARQAWLQIRGHRDEGRAG